MRETRLELAMPIWKTGVIPSFTTLANFKELSPRRESNPLPQMYETCARPIELLGQSGDSGRTRTCGLLFRRQALLIPSELRSRHFKELRGRGSNSQSPRS